MVMLSMVWLWSDEIGGKHALRASAWPAGAPTPPATRFRSTASSCRRRGGVARLQPEKLDHNLFGALCIRDVPAVFDQLARQLASREGEPEPVVVDPRRVAPVDPA